jgi:DNA-binding NarL/FixJ family response regulator
MFVSTPGGAEGYMAKRIKPDRLLDPVLDAANQFELVTTEPLGRVKSYFQELLQPQTNQDNSVLAMLTRREYAVLALLSKGRTDKEIAQSLGISVWTVHDYIKEIFGRLGVRNRIEAVIKYLEK